MLTARTYRIALTPEQAKFAEPIGNICRSVWHTALEQRCDYCRRDAWRNCGLQVEQLTEAKTEHSWLHQAPSHVLQQTLQDLNRACREQGPVRVRWRSAWRWSPSFWFPEGGKITVQRLGCKWARAKLPKLSWIRFRWSYPLGGTVRSATVSRDWAHWFVSFLVEEGATMPKRHAAPGSAVGMDRGVATAVATSNGALLGRQFRTLGKERRYRRLQQRLTQLALESLVRSTGTTIVTVPAAYTSHTYLTCRVVPPDNHESQAVYRYLTCGHVENANVNAAKNILASGQTGTSL